MLPPPPSPHFSRPSYTPDYKQANFASRLPREGLRLNNMVAPYNLLSVQQQVASIPVPPVVPLPAFPGGVPPLQRPI